MWRPATQQSGTNEVPLGGSRRRFGAPPEDDYRGGSCGGPPPQQHPQQQQPDHRPSYGSSAGYDHHAPPPSNYGGGHDSRGPPGGGYDARGPPGDSYDAPRGRDGYSARPPAAYGAAPPPASYGASSAPSHPGLPPVDSKRERDAEDGDAPRKRRSRWGDASANPNPTLPTMINANVSQAELDAYATRMRVEEINNKLRTGDIVPPERQRSPSPPPTYDAQGRRTNTREVRYRRKLEDERVRLVDRALKLDPAYRPPTEYHTQKRNNRPQDKVYIPVKEFPEVNFFGLLVGPRGNSLKKMERDSGAKISIRGKGSVKEGKGRPENTADDAEDDLHCLITADDMDKVRACVNLINNVIATAASTPEGQNDHKRNQLRELAALNGTLRDDENQVCQNCGNLGHKKWDCPEQRNFNANITCHNCGSQGHMARDCRNPRGVRGAPGGGPGGPGGPVGGFDAEYASLMNELGEGGGTAAKGAVGMIEGGAPRPPWAAGGQGGGDPGAPKLAPWRDPNNWITPNQRSHQMPQAQPYGAQGGYSAYGQPQQPYGAQPQQMGYGANAGGYPGYAAPAAATPWAAAAPTGGAASAQPSAYESYYASLAANGGSGMGAVSAPGGPSA